jgi:hypothetical protein
VYLIKRCGQYMDLLVVPHCSSCVMVTYVLVLGS